MTNLNIAKLYLANNTNATAAQIDTAVTDGTALTAINALTTAQFVEAAYQAAFGRAADAEGLAYWSDKIDNQGMAADDAFMTALNYGATVYVAPTVDAPLVIGGVTFTAATVSATDDVVVAAAKATAEAAASSASVGSVAAAVVDVVDATTAAAAAVVIDAADAVADAANTATTFTLTTSADAPALSNVNDTITGAINTLSSNDTITDSSITDADVMNVELLGGGVVGSTVAITNVEDINFTVLSGTNTVTGTNITGYNNMLSVNSAGTLATTGLKSLTADYGLTNSTGGLTLAFAATTISGTADALNVNLNNVSNGGTLAVTAGIETLNLHTSNGAAKLAAITDTANNIATVVVDGGQDFTVTGVLNAAATTVDARDAGVTTISTASITSAVLTGSSDDKITKTVTDNNADLFSLGGGNDTLTFSGVAATGATSTFSGIENFVMKNNADAINLINADTVANIEFQGGTTWSATNLLSGSTVDSTTVANSTGTIGFQNTVLNEATVLDLTKGGTSVTAINVADLTVNYTGASTGAIVLEDTANNGTAATQVTEKLTLNINSGTFTAGTITQAAQLTDLTITTASTGATGIGAFAAATSLTNLDVTTTASAVTLAAIGGGTASATLDNVDINITAGSVTLGGSTVAANANGISTIEIDSTGGAFIGAGFDFQNTTGSINQVTLTGTKDITADFVADVNNVNTVTSTTTGGVSLDIENNGTAFVTGSTVSLGNAALGKINDVDFIAGTNVNNTVTGGTGVDDITTLDGNDTISTGAGADIITAGGGADTMTGGTGADTYVLISAGTTGTFGVTTATAVTGTIAATAFDKIIGYSGTAGDKDIIDDTATAYTLETTNTAATVTLNAASLVTAWATASTLAEKIVEAETALAGATANATLAFVDSGNTYLLIGDGTDGLTQGDVLVELTGVAASAGITIVGGDITNIA